MIEAHQRSTDSAGLAAKILEERLVAVSDVREQSAGKVCHRPREVTATVVVRQLGESGASFRRHDSWRDADSAGNVAKHRVLRLEKRRILARVRDLQDDAPIIAVD
jgi:hypothetical protein